MRRIKIMLLVAALAIGATLTGCGTSPAQSNALSEKDFLTTNGRDLVNQNEEKVILRGTNAGGYLLQEFWMTPTADSIRVHAQQDVIGILEERFGAEQAATLIDAYETAYWTEDDFKNCADMGMNVVRLPFWWRNLANEDGTLKENAFDCIDWFVETAGNYGLYVVLDMHGTPGSQNGSDHSGVDGLTNKPGASRFWFGSDAAANQELFYELWEKIAEHYKGNPIVAGYDLMNEPFCTYRYDLGISDNELHEHLWDVYDNAYDRIKVIDPDHIIIMEAVWDPADLPDPALYGWENVMYEYHNYLYDDYNNEHGGQISNMEKKLSLITAANYDVPSYMGEFNYFDSYQAWSDGLALLNDFGMSWTTWSYKAVASYGNWGLYNHAYDMNEGINLETASYDDILAWWQKVGTDQCKPNQKLIDVMTKAMGE